MAKLFFYDDSPPQRVYVPVRRRKRYGFFGFLFDCTLAVLTSGLWLVWVFVREMRRR